MSGANGNGQSLADRLPPHSLDAERSVIGGVLLDNTMLNGVRELLGVEDFYRQAYQIIYRAICDLDDEGRPVDPIILIDELERRDQYKQIGGEQCFLEISQSIPHPANTIAHAQIVLQKSISRQAMQSSTEIIRDGYSNLFTAEQLLEGARNKFARIRARQEPWPELILQSEPEALPFPVDVFPVPLRRFCLQAAAVTSSAADIPGAAMLATASAAIGQSCNIYVKRTHHESPLLYLLIVADPGKSKTPGIKLVVKPLVSIDRKLREQSKQAKQHWDEAKKAAGKAAGEAPPPLRAIVKDITRETLVAVLAANPRGVLANPDEATAWVGSFDQYKSKGTDRQFWLDIWASTPHSVDREGGNRSFYVHSPLVTVVAGIPPEMLGSLAEEQGRNDGFRDRLLFIMPELFPARRWIEDELDQGDETTWSSVIEKLQAQSMFYDETKQLLRPYVIGFSPQAKAIWVDWYNRHCEEMESPEAPPWAPGVYSKLVSYCARFALILSRLRIAMDPEAGLELIRDPVIESDILGAIKLVEYFNSHFARVDHRQTGGTGDREAMLILAWIVRKGVTEFRDAELRKDLRRRFSNSASIIHPLRSLVEAGAIRPKFAASERPKRGRKPTQTYEVRPGLEEALKTPLGAPRITLITRNSPGDPF